MYSYFIWLIFFMESLLDKIVAIAYEAGKIALEYQNNGFKSYNKGFNDIVTEADLKVNEFLKQELLSLIPESGWLSEESIDDKSRLSKKFVWIVDPIDGTKQFAKGTDEWVISIALVEDKKPIIGVIYNPRRDEMYFTERCLGTYLNDYRVSPSSKNDLQQENDENIKPIILTTKSKSNYLKLLAKGYQKSFKIEQIGSLAYILALTSSGYASSCITFKPTNEWDIAAGVLMLKESNCSFTLLGADKNNFHFNKENVFFKNGFLGADKSTFNSLNKN